MTDPRDPRAAEEGVPGLPSAAMPQISLTCDRRLRLTSPVAGMRDGSRAEIAIDRYYGSGGASWELSFTTGPQGLVTPPLPGDALAALSTGEVLTVVFDLDAEPGGFTAVSSRLTGMADALAGLACPAPVQVSAAPATDLTGRGLVWQPADFGRSFDVMSPNPGLQPGARLDQPRGVPSISMQCDGSFWTAGDWPQNGPRFILRVTVDGDPATTRDLTMEPRRSQHFPDYFAYDLGPRVLAGRTLRVTSLLDPGLDVLYPLDGLAAALRTAGCP
jgi:hypothetical protein